MSSPTKNRPAGEPQVTYTLRVERSDLGSEPRTRAQFEAVATLLVLSEEPTK